MTTTPIHQGHDFYVPTFEVKLEGRSPGADVVRDILQVSYRDSIREIDNFEITINNWNEDRRDLKYSDDELFDPGKELELWMGYYGERMRLMIKGEITSLRPSFPAGGSPTLAISGLNVLHRLRQEQRSHTYEDKTDSEIARQIGQRLGVNIVTDNTAAANEDPYDYLFQDNQYDIIFLMERAQRIGYDLFVRESGENGQSDESEICFGPSVNVRDITYELTYGQSLIQFQPNLTTANQVGEVTVRSWDNARKRKIEATATREDIATEGISPVIEQSFNQRKEVLTRPVESEAEARTLAVETLQNIAKEMVTGNGSTVGLPDLRAGGVVQIGGLGSRFSGRYFVTSTTHEIGDSGYTTRFECRLEETR